MANEFRGENGEDVQQEYTDLLDPVTIQFEPHIEFKTRVPDAIGLIRTGDTTQYGNIILESA
jgi:D-ribose pyranase